MADNPADRHHEALASRLVAALLIVVLPAIIIWTLLDGWQDTLGREAESALRDDMRAVLRRAASMGDLRSRSAWLFEHLLQRSWTAVRLAPRLARLARRHPGVLDVYLFDARGRRVELPGRPHERVVASQQFLKSLLDEQAPVPPKLVAAFAGNPLAPRLLAVAPGVFVDLMNGDHRTWAGWWKLTDDERRVTGHVVVFLHRAGVAPDRLLDQSLNEAQRLVGQRGLLCGWWDPVTSQGLRPQAASFPAELAGALASLPAGVSEPVVTGRPAVIHQVETGVVLFCIANVLPVTGDGLRHWRLVLIALTVILAVFLALAGSERLPVLLRLRGKLVLLFLLGGGLPLAVLLITAVVDRRDREEVLLSRYRQAQAEHLTRVDGDLSSWFAPIVQRYELAVAAMARQASDTVRVPDSLRRWVQAQGEFIIQVLVIDRQRRLIYFHHGDKVLRGARLAATREMMRDYAARILQSYNSERVSAGPDTAQSGLMTNLAGRATSGLEHSRSIQMQSIGQQVMLSYMGFMHREAGRAEMALVAMHRSRTAQIRYLDWLRRVWRRPGPLSPRLIALPINPGADWPAFPHAGSGADPTLRALRDLAVATRLPQHITARIGGREYLLSALSGRLLEGYVLMLAQPYLAIAEETQVLNRRLLILSLGVLMLAGLAAFVTASLLLRPIAALGRGLQALHERQFRRRIDPGRVVELAMVAERFNVIMADLRDLEIARSVQEHLWPAQALDGVGYALAGKCTTAADLGGDHHDWFVLPDGRVVLGVGDVAGHGVASALVAAAAKVELALMARRHTGPAAILESMNRAFTEQVGKVRPMTFWLGILDPASGRLDHASAGHNFPIVLIGDDQPLLSGTPGYPLGSRRKANYTEGWLDLSRGGWVFAYTDGLVEAANAAGEPFGYERLVQTAGAVRADTPAAAAAQFIAAVAEWSPRDPPEDDQTLVVLRVDPRPIEVSS